EIRNLTARTNGNPFYVTEIARLEQEAATIGSSAAPAELPESIRSVVQMRFSSLPEPTRHLVRVASVFPREFSFSLLRDITGDDEDAMLDAIDQALATDFLRPVEQHPEHYRFAHDIVREAIVSTWSPSRLARWHRKAAEVLETSHAGRTSMVAGDL